MAVPVYSHNFFGIKGLSGAFSYTVPAGFTAVIRSVDAYNSSTFTTNLFLHGSAGEAIWWARNNFPGGSFYASFRGRVIINELSTFDVTTDAEWDVNVNGYLLTLP